MATVALIFAIAAFVVSLLALLGLGKGGGSVTVAGGGPARDNSLRDWAQRMELWGRRIANAVDNLEQSQDSAQDANGDPIDYPANDPTKHLGGPGDGSGAPPGAPGL